ncbi:MAG: hypothetical protein R3279_05075 [Putridiphycobacter sp.]|nr:hypothetical protein [Putridiphycobacter sp.]
MRLIVQNIIYRILTFTLLLFLINYVYVHFFYDKDLAKHSDLIAIIDKIPDSTDILYVAESSNTALAEDDIDRRTIAEFLDEALPGQKVNDLTKPAAHAGIYKVLLSAIPETSNIKTIVLTLNLRSFNAQWIHSSLETSLQKSLVFLKTESPLLNRFLLSFKGYPIKSEREQEAAFKAKWLADPLQFPYNFEHQNVSEWDYWMAINGVKNDDGTTNQALTELACHYIKGYGFQIDTLTNPRISDFNEIIQLCRERNWHLVLNLLAENVEKAEILVGSDLTYLMDYNRDLLVAYYSRKGVLVVDNLETVPDKYFIDQNWTTEHYSDAGRKAVAEKVASVIEQNAKLFK